MKSYTNHSTLIAVLMVVLPCAAVNGQSSTQHTFTRGKFWTVISESVPHPPIWLASYPGYFEAPSNWFNTLSYWAGDVDGTQQTTGGFPGFNIVHHTLVKNYNFTESMTEAEEYSFETVTSVDPSGADVPVIPLTVSRKRMVWSLPKYDDFIIQREVITNESSVQVTNWYYSVAYGINISLGIPYSVTFDDEYLWDPGFGNFRMEQGNFVFYDDTSMPPNQAAVAYDISPGDQTGDRGDPGNITIQNSIDRRLYSPQLFTDNIVYVTPNKHGETTVYQGIFHRILNENPGAPDEEFWQPTNQDPTYVFTRMTAQQARMSWRDANADGGTLDGNQYERVPSFNLGIGPYDIAPGDSVELIRVVALGEMDRNVSELGGLNATQNYLSQGLANLKANWQAALDIVDGFRRTGNWNEGISAFPPPTVGDAPFASNDDELQVDLYVDTELGTQGFELMWTAVPPNYRDPITGTNDFAGYKVYRSESRIEGPWIEAADLTRTEAEGLTAGGKVTFRLPAEPGIPYRHWVTSYDLDGNESGFTAYTFHALAAKPAPSNDMSEVLVIPNPFRQVSGLSDPSEEKRISFLNIPGQCTIRIFTVAGELVRTIEHNDGFGEEAWGSAMHGDYLLTRFFQNVQPGVYIYHIESHVQGHEGESSIGKFMIIK
ncbi:MAG: hypothetical protein OXL40_02440 [Bacteroidota bacterium]|nr:hypothetical protein [Bacteroidota bacterium]